MIKLGITQELVIHRINEHGAYLGEPQDDTQVVLLPGKQIPEGASKKDKVSVFVYRDSEDRLIATVARPALELGGLARVRVVDVGGIGAFLDWGLEKDLFLPFKEQTCKLRKGDHCIVTLYIDKSDRLCATMKIYDHLRTDSPYQENDQVRGTIYQINDQMGALVAVDLKYHGLIPKNEFFGDYKLGDEVSARVIAVRGDGKLNLAVREKAYLKMDEDAQMVLERLVERNGVLPFTDKAAPLVIEREFGLSKNAFKRAVGRLLKERKVVITDSTIELLK